VNVKAVEIEQIWLTPVVVTRLVTELSKSRSINRVVGKVNVTVDDKSTKVPELRVVC